MWSVGSVERTDGWDESILNTVRTVLTRPFPYIYFTFLCIMLEVVDLIRFYKLNDILVLRKNSKKK